MLLGGFASIALALASVSPDVLPPNALPPNAPPNADASLPAPKALKPCRGESDCISSAGTESPNHFQAPLALGAGGRAAAYRGAVGALREAGCAVRGDAATYVVASCPDGDDVELLLRDDVATFRAAARRKGLTPPWCTEKNCINGSMAQRKRVLALGAKLGWSPIDATNMEDEGRWTPIFFNTDAVPRDE